MKSSGVSPDVFTLITVVGGLCKVGDWQEAELLLRRMLQQGVRPYAITLEVVRVPWLKDLNKKDSIESIIEEKIS